MQKGTDYFTEMQPQPSIFTSTIGYVMEPDENKRVLYVTTDARTFIVYQLNNTAPVSFQNLPSLINVKCNGQDEQFIFSIFTKCYGRDPDAITWNKPDKPDKLTVYCHLASRSDPLFDILNETKFSIIDYNSISKQKLGFFIPFARTSYVDMRLLVPKQKAMTSIYPFLTIDMLYYTLNRKAVPNPVDDAVNNFYHLFFPFVAPITEDFSDSQNISLAIDYPIDIQIIVNKYDDLKVATIPLQNLNLVKGDKVTLSKQISSSANGKYYVSKVETDKLTLCSYAYAMNFYDNFKIKKTKHTDGTLVGDLASTSDVSGNVWFIDLDAPGTVVNGQAVIRPIVAHDGKYRCVPSIEYKTQETCESPIDPFGDEKTQFNLWDKPCEKNTDCPFWVKQTDRGKCIDGYCEMPLGVQRLGYTRYVDSDGNGKPYCHGCPDPLKPDCCDKQANPDYAFGGDYFEKDDRMSLF